LFAGGIEDLTERRIFLPSNVNLSAMTRTSTMLLEGLKDQANQGVWLTFDRRYRGLLLGVGRRLGLSASDAEDAAQETLAAFVEKYRAGQYRRESGRLRDWLAGIMAHKVRDIQRRTHRERSQMGGIRRNSTIEAVEDSSIAASIEQEWTAAVLRECLERVRQEVLPQALESFELYALHQLPAQVVAERLGISVDSVYQNKRRILGRIRQLLPQIEDSW
jgi:RNA polymerase sigma factor (sigma-70 family)